MSEAAVAVLAARLLGAEVVDRAHRRAGQRDLGLAEGPRDPEVGDLDPAVAPHEDVGRLDVAVDDAADVRRVEGLRDLGGHAGGLARRERPVLAQDRGEVLAVDQLHDDVRARAVLAEVEHRHDARVAERRRRPGLVAEPAEEVGVLAELGAEELDGDVAIQLGVAGAVDRRHPALAEELDQAVAAAEDAPDLGHGVLSLPRARAAAPDVARHRASYHGPVRRGPAADQRSSDRRYSRMSPANSGRPSASSTDARSQPIVVPAS